jgi:hypothetical protein
MGLLDDAIKEHLELKRKHGAAEEELRRQETEALGPARRDFNAEGAAQPVEPAAEPGDPATAEPEPVAEPAGWLDDEPAAPFEPTTPPPLPAEEPSPEEPPAEEPSAEEPLPAPDPAPVAETVPAPPRRESDTPTEGFDALSRDEEAAPEGDEDVLEETPDFLQDTPEHDRLWFEQKPPRDFDFDG